MLTELNQQTKVQYAARVAELSSVGKPSKKLLKQIAAAYLEQIGLED
ncbi:hypothetical protein ACFQZX_14000 [Mucilaginibacter litoreus]|uniref:Uncharacterized protein n=1 Tax=Mucilaginibacter litoreus TaxID=1048221 RepID=A0ABW3AV47_9SPHI